VVSASQVVGAGWVMSIPRGWGVVLAASSRSQLGPKGRTRAERPHGLTGCGVRQGALLPTYRQRCPASCVENDIPPLSCSHGSGCAVYNLWRPQAQPFDPQGATTIGRSRLPSLPASAADSVLCSWAMTFQASPGIDLDDPQVIAVLDEVPLWSAPFGLALLGRVRLRRNLRVLEVGCGTGFPLVELAQRLGPSCQLVGLDPWRAVQQRAELKIKQVGLTNVELVCGTAEKMPFADESFDLVVSNNGLSNVADLDQALAECARVCEPGAQLVATHNLPATMAEVYLPYEAILTARGLTGAVERLHAHIRAKRKTVTEMVAALERAGFERAAVTEDVFHMRFLDGTTMLQHFLIRIGFLEPWRAIAPSSDVDAVLAELTERLDEQARQAGELRLTIPFACIDAVAKPSAGAQRGGG